MQRFNSLLSKYSEDNIIECGCDEAGRGCLAGSVFAAAVILPNDFYDPLLNDSKKLSAKQRDKLRIIIEKEAIAYSVADISAQEIDKINILRASILGMHRAIDGLKLANCTIRPQLILVDGNKFYQYDDIPHRCIIKGDGKYASIAAASILAKTYRDERMLELDKEFPLYGWKQNMAYPTKKHREAILNYGITPYHRLSFRLKDQEPTLF